MTTTTTVETSTGGTQFIPAVPARPFGLVRHSLVMARRRPIQTIPTPEQPPDVPLPQGHDNRFRRSRGGSKQAMFAAVLGGDMHMATAAHDAFDLALIAAPERGEVKALAGAEEALPELRTMGGKVASQTGSHRTVGGCGGVA